MASKAILIGMSTLQTVAKANSTKPEGGARKDGLARSVIRRNECWVPGFRSVREEAFETPRHAAIEVPSFPGPAITVMLGEVMALFPIALRRFEQLAVGN